MPRRKRFYAPGVPFHIVQRGNNRQNCFFSNRDFAFFVNLLVEALDDFNVRLHAFVLMNNHVHLLMTPNSQDGISKVMQSIGRRYVRYFNSAYSRTGTLWEGRHKASLIDSESYLLTCQRYIELNPVRANIVARPSEYLWSSYHANALGKKIKAITPHEVYLRLGENNASRLCAYKKLFNEGIPVKQIQQMRECISHDYPLGNEKFVRQIEAALDVQVGYKKPGRPKTAIAKRGRSE